MKTPDQALYDALFKICIGLKYKTYDFLPPEGTGYPFVVVGNTEILPFSTKSYAIGRIAARVDVWASYKSRKQASDMMNKIVYKASTIKHLQDNIKCSLRINDTNIRLLQDNSTNDNLWHGIIELTFNFY